MIEADVWLSLALYAGGRQTQDIFRYFHSAEAVYDAGPSGRNNCGIFSPAQLKRLNDPVWMCRAQKTVERCRELGVSVLPFSHPGYPNRLREIDDPPWVLYVSGNMPNFDQAPALCIVGPRKATEYGLKCAYSLAARLALSGFIIVSGGATGVDAAAHEGALLHGGITCAVLGGGVLCEYPKENEALRAQIRRNGCLISEYPPDEPARKRNFLIRNRLMSALSLGVILVEAPERSGSLNTVRHAVDQNRDVFVIPGNPGNPHYAGSNALLHDGAIPVYELGDILEEYLPFFGEKISPERAAAARLHPFAKAVPAPKTGGNRPKKEKSSPSVSEENRKQPVLQEKAVFSPENKKILPESLSKNAKIVYNHLDKQEFSCDDLASTGLSVSEIMSALGELEIFGFISGIPGGFYTVCL